MSADYPVFLRLSGLTCVVIGGGYGTERRVNDLLDAGARVTLISSVSSPEIESLADEERIRWIKRKFASGDLAGANLVVSSPEDRTENAVIWQEAQIRGIFMNAIDDPAHGNFIFPAIYRQGDLTVTVSTAGKSPALAVFLRDNITAGLGPEYGVFLDLLGEIRADVMARIKPFPKRLPVWRRLIQSGALELVRDGRIDDARSVLRAVLDAVAPQGDSRNGTARCSLCAESQGGEESPLADKNSGLNNFL